MTKNDQGADRGRYTHSANTAFRNITITGSGGFLPSSFTQNACRKCDPVPSVLDLVPVLPDLKAFFDRLARLAYQAHFTVLEFPGPRFQLTKFHCGEGTFGFETIGP